MPRPDRAVPLLVVLLAVLVAAGCTGVPTASQPVTAKKVEAGVTIDPADDVTLIPRGPFSGAEPEDVVRGWLAAMKSDAGDFAIARKYLTGSAARRWLAGNAVSVVTMDCIGFVRPDGTCDLRGQPTGDGRRMQIKATPVGALDAHGSYSPAQPGSAPIVRTLSLVKVAVAKGKAEWRIASVPDGLLLTQDDFNLVYHPVNLFYGAQDSTALIPDRRYFAENGDALVDRMVDELIDGPSTQLAGAVETAIPAGSRLRDAFTASKGTLTVDLSGGGLYVLGAEQGQLLAAQFVWTLRQFDVVTIVLLRDGQSFNDLQSNGRFGRNDWKTYDPDVVDVNALSYLIDPAGKVAGVGPDDTLAATLDTPVVAAAVGKQGTVVVGVTRPAADDTQRVVIGQPQAQQQALYTGRQLASPSWGGSAVYVVQERNQVFRIDQPTAKDPQQVKVSPVKLPDGFGPIDQFVMSRAGVRAAIVSGGTLLLGTVQAQAQGEKTNYALAQVQPIVPSLTGVVSVAWADADHLAVLVSKGSDAVPWLVSVDGYEMTSQPTTGLPQPAEAIAAVPDGQLMCQVGGQVWELSGNSWLFRRAGTQPEYMAN